MKSRVGELVLERRVDGAQIGARRFQQAFRHLIRPLGPFPIRDIDKDRIDEAVGQPLPGARMHARRGLLGQHRLVRIAMVQIGDDVGRIHHDDVAVHQDRHFDPAVDRFQRRMVRLQQAVDGLAGEALVVEHHAHLAGEWAECAVVELDHGALPMGLRPPRRHPRVLG